jgi:hypothetical protein
MSSPLRVILEIGPKRRVAAGAMDWPGLDRWGTSEDDALARLAPTAPAMPPSLNGSSACPARARPIGGASPTSRRKSKPRCCPKWTWSGGISLLQAGWDHFDEVAARVSAELRKGARGGGRERDQIIRHVYASERHNWWRKVGIRADDDVRLSPDELAAYRQQ